MKKGHRFFLYEKGPMQLLIENGPITTVKGIPQTYFNVFKGIVSLDRGFFKLKN
jgi:hypothetical protein